MNKIPFLVFLIISLFLSNCYYNNDRTINNSSKTVTNIKFVKTVFEEPYEQIGYYYSYNFKSLTDKIDNVKEYLNDLANKGFKIKAAWYFGGGSCGNTDTYVRPQFIIQLDKNDFGLIDYNFSSLSEKPKLACDKSNTKYIPQE